MRRNCNTAGKTCQGFLKARGSWLKKYWYERGCGSKYSIKAVIKRVRPTPVGRRPKKRLTRDQMVETRGGHCPSMGEERCPPIAMNCPSTGKLASMADSFLSRSSLSEPKLVSQKQAYRMANEVVKKKRNKNKTRTFACRSCSSCMTRWLDHQRLMCLYRHPILPHLFVLPAPSRLVGDGWILPAQ